MASSPAAEKKISFTGRRRARSTRSSVLWIDRLARLVIALGGIGTIISVSLVYVLLASVVVPLFLPESLQLVRSPKLNVPAEAGRPLHVAADEYLQLAWAAYADGSVATFRADTGEL